MDRKQQVFLRLKLKAKALGFNAKELKGIAAKIADNLASTDDASDEDANAEIDEKIDAVLPYLSFGQSQANRLLDEWKKNHPGPDDSDGDGGDEEPPANADGGHAGPKNKPKDKGNVDAAPAWAKGMMDTIQALNDEITALKGKEVTSSRKSKLEALLKDAGTFGALTLKSFPKMKFEDDGEFDEFISDVEEDLKAYNQERADAGLSALGNPPAAGGGKPVNENEPYSDAEIDALAEM